VKRLCHFVEKVHIFINSRAALIFQQLITSPAALVSVLAYNRNENYLQYIYCKLIASQQYRAAVKYLGLATVQL